MNPQLQLGLAWTLFVMTAILGTLLVWSIRLVLRTHVQRWRQQELDQRERELAAREAALQQRQEPNP